MTLTSYPEKAGQEPPTLALFYNSASHSGNTLDLDFTVVDQWEDISGLEIAIPPVNVEVNPITGDVTILKNGLYTVTGRMEFDSTVSNITYTGAVFINGEADVSTTSNHFVKLGAIKGGLVSVGNLLSLEKGDVLAARFKASAVPSTMQINAIAILINARRQ